MANIFLHLGAGTRKIAGFINIDIEDGADLKLDLTQPLPWPDGSVQGIFSEHFIEHISQADAISLLRECRRVLAPGGVIRIATPDLNEMVQDYLQGRIHPDWEKFGINWTANACERLNIGMRWWGHQWMYDEEELTRLAQMVGLVPKGRYRIGESEDPRFCNLEYRESSTLILEFRKPDRMLAADATPLVSITIPSYKPEFFEAALLSALNQTYKQTEIVICDDCPDDGILRIVNRYTADHPNIRYFRNPARLNRENLVKCVAKAEGEFIKFLNDDDILVPHCIERMLDCYRRHPDLAFVTSKRQRIDAKGQPLEEIFETLCAVSEDAVIDGISIGACLLSSFRNFVGEPTTALFRKAEVAHLKPDQVGVIELVIGQSGQAGAVSIEVGALQGIGLFLGRHARKAGAQPSRQGPRQLDLEAAAAVLGEKRAVIGDGGGFGFDVVFRLRFLLVQLPQTGEIQDAAHDQVRGKPRPSGRGRIARTAAPSYNGVAADNQGSLRQGMPEVTPVEIRVAVAHSAQEPTEATQSGSMPG